jgi:RNA polymerase sigma-70 factor (ECF subfamily)
MQTTCTLTDSDIWHAESTADESSDRHLIESIAAGNRRAMHILFARHNLRVYRFVLRLTDNTATAEDLVSEVFLDVWLNARKFEGRSQVATWMLAIARNKAIAILRRRSAEQLDDKAAAMIEDTDDNPETSKARKEHSTLLKVCLMQLSPAHREVIDLTYYQERSIDEVAKIIGVPAATVKTRMHYARKKIAILLATAGIDRGACL